MLALAQHKAETCPLCGRPLSVCTAPDVEGKVEVPPPTRCHYTNAIEQARKPYQDGKAQNPGALMFTARLRASRT